jgi:hypothetical protein
MEASDQGDELVSYRQQLVEAHRSASDAYDKALMTLSGGALVLSISFVRYIAPSPKAGTRWLLAVAWTLLALSVAAILTSMLTSQWALVKTIDQVDQGKIRGEPPGGPAAKITRCLNVSAAALFVVGVIFLALFAVCNVA